MRGNCRPSAAWATDVTLSAANRVKATDPAPNKQPVNHSRRFMIRLSVYSASPSTRSVDCFNAMDAAAGGSACEISPKARTGDASRPRTARGTA